MSSTWVYSANGKMIFFWFDAGDTSLLDECATSVAWVPVVARGGRTLTESFPFSIAARKVRDVLKTLDEELLALMTA